MVEDGRKGEYRLQCYGIVHIQHLPPSPWFRCASSLHRLSSLASPLTPPPFDSARTKPRKSPGSLFIELGSKG